MTTSSEPLVLQVKSRLLPLSAWLGAAERLIERLPRSRIPLELEAGRDVEVIDVHKGDYKSTGNSPSFAMTFYPALPQVGWYYLEAALVRNNGSRDASICADIRPEGKESIVIPIPSNLRGSVREVFYLPPNISALRWLPTAAAGYFSQSRLLLHRITPLESVLRRMSRVIFDLWRFRNRAVDFNADIGGWGALSNLQEAYQRTATLRLHRPLDNAYPAFIAVHDTLKQADIRCMRKQLRQLAQRPLISLIMFVEFPEESGFRAALASVIGQIYPHWELLLAGHFSADAKTVALIDEYRSNNVQIKIVPATPGANLASTFNRALELAQGEFVMRIDQHDRITPHAVFLLAQEINTHPDAALVYSDDDRMDDDNHRHDPRFKPDWNPELFFTHDYMAHLVLYRHVRLLEVGGYRSGFEGAEDYDLTLRYIRDVPRAKIRHVAKILCHSRSRNQPLSAAAAALPVHDRNMESRQHAAMMALQAYFDGSGITVSEGLVPGICRIKYPLPPRPPLVSIIIPTRDQVEILMKCVNSIRQHTDYENWEMLVVDNQSAQPETLACFAQLQSDPRIRVIHYESKFNYSALNNFAVQHARGEVLALLNNDVEVIAPGWLTEMVSHALRPEVGAVGAKLLYSNGTVQHGGVILGMGGVAGHAHRYLKGDAHGYCQRAVATQNLSAVTGACLVVRKGRYREVGGLNETDLAVAFNDIDFCLKLVSAGYRNVFTPHALLYHHESLSRGPDDTPEKHARFTRECEYMKNTWAEMLENDHAYNPNLTLEFETFALGEHRQAGQESSTKNAVGVGGAGWQP